MIDFALIGYLSILLFIALIWIPESYPNKVVGFWILCAVLFLVVCTVYMKKTKVDKKTKEIEAERQERQRRALEQERTVDSLRATQMSNERLKRREKQMERAAQKKREVAARLEQQMGPDLNIGESGKVDLSVAFEYGQRYGFFEEWDLERMAKFLEVEMDAEEFVELQHVPDLVEWVIVNSEYGWWLDHRFHSKDAIWEANQCLKRFGLGLDQGAYENGDVEIIDKERKTRKTRIILKGPEPTEGEGGQRMERSIEFYFVSVQDVACRINDLIDPEGLIFLQREESDDHYDFALVKKDYAERIVHESELGFVFPDRSELPELTGDI